MWWKEIVRKYKVLEKELQDINISKEDLLQKSKDLGNISKEYEIAQKLEDLHFDLEEISAMIVESKEQWLFDQKKEAENAIEILHKEFVDLKDKSKMQSLMLEIRPGAGGDEAGLFAYILLEMYIRYSQHKNWSIEIMSKNITEVKGLKEAVLYIKGENAYDIMQYESGVHRVQRVPQTESSGRIHTSTATVAALEEKEDIEVEIKHEHLRMDVYRSSGPGGQSVNTTDSAVRLTYSSPDVDQIVVCMQDEKSQHKNRERGMKVLKTRLRDAIEQKQHKEMADHRKTQVGSGDRSERIRTYNFPQNRITDHRSKLTVHGLNEIFVTNPDTLEKVIFSMKEKNVHSELNSEN
ncbi:PCRF domain-containing protein [Candidatus Cytomitobacter indipagum]|uniref:PCRF domain-containing protein n=1 Tax=Candidatus Cytomitobacter indipagum TaxID=2601575 RepID=A0A5C0UDW7_9PROT|nr:PCRF domain-containing protein [Candidatus Cytomitobacter indipagum]QEK37890.1 PCRF domain-containing protein [Candidatus Cytomitobacter indipagum]